LTIPGHYRPIYRLTIKNPSGKEYEYNSWYFKTATGKKEKQNNKLAIYVDRDLDKKLDLCMIGISLRGGALMETASSLKAGEIKIGAEIKVYLGYAVEDEEKINLTEADLAFVGIVDEVSQSFTNISLTAYSMAYKIIFKNAEAEDFPDSDWKDKKKSSKEIVTHLLNNAVEIDGSNFKPGLSFSSYKPDTKLSIYDNISQLSDYNGFNFYISKNGKARFHETGSKSHTFKYGEDILENSITMSKPQYDSVEVELTYKELGNNPKKTITYEPIAGSKTANNKKEEKKTINLGIDANVTLAEQVAKNILNKLYTPETGQVKIIGNTSVDLGDKLTISFAGTAPGAAELSYMGRSDVIITGISHRFSKKSGFVTTIGWKKTALR
jgi:hypothetical protein